MGGINEGIGGRFRKKGEYVRVGAYVAPAPEHVAHMIEETLSQYSSNNESYFIDAISLFHLAFERIHPFCDGNGRIGRVLMNWQLLRHGFPSIIIRDKEKAEYYRAFRDYSAKKSPKLMAKIIGLALMESLHKRIAYLNGDVIIDLTVYAKQAKKSVHAMLNAARRQTILAFREKGVWKIGVAR